MDMGEPFGKASGRIFGARSTYVPDPCWNSLWVISSNSLKISIRPPSEALKGGLPMAASYNFGDTPCPFRHLPIISHLLNGYHEIYKNI
jgi:hypothetical protein